MRNTLLTAALTLLVTSPLVAGEAHVQRHMKVVLGDPGDALVIEDDDLEIGETRQYFTDSGKEVLITRTEEGRTIEIEGRTLQIPDAPEGFVFSDGGGQRRVIVHKERLTGDGSGEHRAFAFRTSHGADADGAAGEPHIMMLHRRSASKHLDESGALDDLDLATRERILETLREIEPGAGAFQWTHDLSELGDLGEHQVEIIRIERREEIHERGDDD